jgi:adenylate cyclase
MQKAHDTRPVTARPLLILALVSLFLGLLFMLLDASVFGLEDRSLDLRFRLRGPQSTEHSSLFLVEVDNRSYKDLDQRFPFSRGIYAHLFRNLKRLGVKAVVLDIQFTEHVAGDEEGLAAFVEALREGPPTLLAGELVQDRRSYFRLDTPLECLLAAQPAWGLVNDVVDRDGVNRLYALSLPSPADSLPVPSLAMALLDLLQITPEKIHLEPGWQNALRINYYGPPGSFPRYSFSDILDGADFELADPDLDSDYIEAFADSALYDLLWGEEAHPFRDRIALVGVSATDLHDNKRTPYFSVGSKQVLTPGVEVHAHAIQTLLDQRFVVNPFAYWRAFILFTAFAFFASYLMLRFRSKQATAFILTIAMAWGVLAQWLFSEYSLWLEVITPFAILASAWVFGMLQHLLRALQERAQIRGMFAHYVPEAVVSELIENPSLLQLGGHEREMSALFSDVAAFTSVSESLSPSELVELLNEYLTAMTDCVTAEGGIIDKYEGDAIIAEFGAPLPAEDHAKRAIRSAIRMQKRLHEMRQDWAKQGRHELRARIGVNSGLMVVGNMGSRQIFDYTAMGDAMNLAARLEGVNKFYASEVLCSESTWQALSGEFLGRCLDEVRVKGKKDSVQLWEVLDFASSSQSEVIRDRIELYDAARALFTQGDFEKATAAFHALYSAHPEDIPAKQMALRAEALLTGEESLPADGIRVLMEK